MSHVASRNFPVWQEGADTCSDGFAGVSCSWPHGSLHRARRELLSCLLQDQRLCRLVDRLGRQLVTLARAAQLYLRQTLLLAKEQQRRVGSCVVWQKRDCMPSECCGLKLMKLLRLQSGALNQLPRHAPWSCKILGGHLKLNRGTRQRALPCQAMLARRWTKCAATQTTRSICWSTAPHDI